MRKVCHARWKTGSHNSGEPVPRDHLCEEEKRGESKEAEVPPEMMQRASYIYSLRGSRKGRKKESRQEAEK